jgi:hypothetical protein
MKNINKLLIAFIAISLMTTCKKEDNIVSNSDAVSIKTESTLANARYNPEIEPDDFVRGINNPYLPEKPGDTYYYQNITVDAGDTTVEDIYIKVTHRTKVIMGVTCEVIHDVVKVDGILMENTFDYYAQDEDGNVWYFGENTRQLQDDGTWSTEGSFISGVDGALPGKVMLANPQAHIGKSYRQEYYVGHALDKAKVLNTNSTVTVPYGTFYNCVETEETSVLDPGVIEHKWYARGIGQIKASVTKGGNELEELISTNHQ